jgi:putative FmdB family regulatory protein
LPTYTYECERCQQQIDIFHQMSASPEVKCAACGGPCKRLIGTGAGIIFKGSGFYETDYKSKKGGGGESKSGGGESKPGGGESKPGGGESKPGGGDSKSGGESKGAGETKSGGEAKSGGGGETKSAPASKPSTGSSD